MNRKPPSDADDAFANAIFAELAKRASPMLAAKLQARGVDRLSDLPQAEADKVWAEAGIEGGASFPGADIEMLRRVFGALADPVFRGAFSRLQRTRGVPFDAFQPVIGVDGAVFLSALGLPVRPLDPRNGQPFGSWSNSAASAAKTFGRVAEAVVAYDPATAPFYLLITDCMDTLADQVARNPKLDAVRQLAIRRGGELPTGPGVPFRHGCIMLPRLPGERIESVFLWEQDPARGSVLFFAGWMDGNERRGMPNGRPAMVPMRVLNSLLHDPMALAYLNGRFGSETPPH